MPAMAKSFIVSIKFDPLSLTMQYKCSEVLVCERLYHQFDHLKATQETALSIQIWLNKVVGQVS